MNAGTRTDWLGSRVATLTLLTHERGLERVPGASIEWGYRTSSIPHDAVVVECELAVHPADPFAVRAKMERALTRRRDTQPMSEASCGSVFKNPEGMSAGELIEQAGMKGFAVGGARVSQKHANFIVNAGGATARDVLELMRIVQTRVYEKHGIELEPEVRLLGFE